jgi:hypothetical protein
VAHPGKIAVSPTLQERAGRKIAVAVLLAVLAFAALLGGPSLGPSADIVAASAGVLFLAASIPWFWGLADLAASKGYSRILAVAGALNVLGLILLALLPSKVAPAPDASVAAADPNSNYPRRATASPGGGTHEAKVRLGQWACVLFLLGVLCLAGGNRIGFMLFQLGVPRATAAMLVDVIGLIGIPPFVFAHGLYGKSKGYSFATALFGLLPCVGLVILLLLPDRYVATAKPTASDPSGGHASGGGYANYKRPY